jgi:hypothetical protein
MRRDNSGFGSMEIRAVHRKRRSALGKIGHPPLRLRTLGENEAYRHEAPPRRRARPWCRTVWLRKPPLAWVELFGLVRSLPNVPSYRHCGNRSRWPRQNDSEIAHLSHHLRTLSPESRQCPKAFVLPFGARGVSPEAEMEIPV